MDALGTALVTQLARWCAVAGLLGPRGSAHVANADAPLIAKRAKRAKRAGMRKATALATCIDKRRGKCISRCLALQPVGSQHAFIDARLLAKAADTPTNLRRATGSIERNRLRLTMFT